MVASDLTREGDVTVQEFSLLTRQHRAFNLSSATHTRCLMRVALNWPWHNPVKAQNIQGIIQLTHITSTEACTEAATVLRLCSPSFAQCTNGL